MAFFEKIGKMAKDAGAKTGDMLETGRLAAQIREEEREIDALKQKLGEVVWLQYAGGGEIASEGVEICVQIQERINAIAALEKEILRRKAAAKKARHKCACGASVAAGMKFCPQCGRKNEAFRPDILCPDCGAKGMPGARFCMGCGAKMPESAPEEV